MKHKVFIIIMGLVLAIAPAYGALVNDDFEENTVGTYPAQWGVNSPYSDMTVVATNAPGTLGSMAVELTNRDGPTYLSHGFSDSNSVMTVEFDYMNNSTNASKAPSIWLRDGTTVCVRMVLSWPEPWIKDAGAWVQVGEALTAGDWYHIKLDINSNSTVSVSITGDGYTQGSYTTNGLNFASGSVGDLDSIRFTYNNGANDPDDAFTIDNVVVTGPGVVITEIGDISIDIDGANAIITWTGTNDVSYALQFDADLVESPSWTNEATGIPGVNGAMSATSAATAVKSFYRVILE